GKARDRHADVGGDRPAAGAKLKPREVGVVARVPELRALLGPGGPHEVLAAVLPGDRLHRLGLLDDARRRAVELEEERRRHAVARLLVPVDGVDGLVAEDFAARDGDARLDGLDDGARAAVDG